VKIKEITEYNPEIKNTVDSLLSLLLGTPAPISELQLKAIITSNNSHLFFAMDDHEAYMGMMTVGIYYAPTGKKGWIEDVVVNEAFRRQGIGKKLIEFAIQFAKQQHVDLLTLTSRPQKIAANNLYKNIGFEKKETNVYKMVF
jgi:ribosomal protein S18 acetylase RimI-like enzyme